VGHGTPRLIGIGAQVFGVFLDGKDSQTPLVLGTVPKIMIPSETRLGSTDGDTPPRSYQSESEVELAIWHNRGCCLTGWGTNKY
jgi:hypothetical protein